MFTNQISHNIEAYINDIVEKGEKVGDHTKDLDEVFRVLRRHEVKLNLEKYVFGVLVRKFLNFMVSWKGIEANLEKIRVILNMQAPRLVKEVQKLAGQMVACSKFMSKLIDKCLTFLRAL